MPRKYYKIELTDSIEIHVYFETVGGYIVNFAVKLILKYEDKLCEIVRFDSAHGCPHKDILNIHGMIKRKIWYEFLDNKQALDMAIKDIKDNYELYVRRFIEWLKK